MRNRYGVRVAGALVAFTFVAAACGDDDGGGGSVEAWCGLMDEANEVDSTFENLETFDSAGLEQALNRAVDVAGDLEAAAPDEIKDDMKVVADTTRGLQSALEDADYSLFDADLSALSDEAANDAAQAALDEYSVRECGQPFGLEDGSGDTASSGDDGDSGDFDPTAGTLREQLITQFVTIGFTQAEAECIADGVDPSDSDILAGDEGAIIALLEACDIPLSRLAELGG
ncbi:MAG: hypothetical protein ACR2O6_14260 [Ilumatobacteraceae bacterium]